MTRAEKRAGERDEHPGADDMCHWRHLRILISMIVATACVHRAAPVAAARGGVRPGITVLIEDSLELIRGKRIALLTNQTGVDASGMSDIELLRGPRARSAGVSL